MVPRTYGATHNHRHLTLLGVEDHSATAAHEWDVLRGRLPREIADKTIADGKRWIESELLKELNDYPNKSWVVFSSEQLSQRLVSDSEVMRLRHALERLGFGTVEIVVYVREQVGLSISWDSMEVLAGRRTSAAIGTEVAFDHQQLLERWQRIWGRGQLAARTYAKPYLEEGDVVVDFFTHPLGLSGASGWLSQSTKRNERPGARGIELMRQVNRLLPLPAKNQPIGPLRSAALFLCKQQWAGGQPRRADPAAIRQLAGHFTDSNRWVDENYGTHLEESFGLT